MAETHTHTREVALLTVRQPNFYQIIPVLIGFFFF